MTESTRASNETADSIETREWLESLDWVLQHGGPERVTTVAQGPPAPRPYGRGQDPVRGHHAPHQHHPGAPNSLRTPAAASSSAASRASSAGTRWRWWCGPTTRKRASAVTSRPTPRPRRSTRSPSTTSSTARASTTTATRSTSRATPHRASTPAPFSRAA